MTAALAVSALSVTPPAVGQSDKVLYLTFDDGPSNQFTWSILDALDDYGAKATFFPIGSKFSSTEDLIRSMVDRGHQIGNHTVTHPNLVTLSDDQVRSELSRANDLIANLAGAAPNCMRPPSGSTDGRVDGIAADMGLSTVLWNRGGNDYGLKSGDEFLDRVRNSQSGDIILLHDPAGPATVEATRKVLEHFTADGYRFETLPQCRSIEPATTTTTSTTTTTTTTLAPTTTTTTTTSTRPPTATTTVPPAAVSDAPIAIRAQGTTGTEIIKLKVNRKIVAAFRLSTSLRDYQYIPRKAVRAKTIQVFFVNDGEHEGTNRDVVVDFISVNGQVFQSEAAKVKSKGSWTDASGCGTGFNQSEVLACKGWFRYSLPKRIRLAS